MPRGTISKSEHVVEREAAGFVIDAMKTEEAAGGVADQHITGFAGRRQFRCGKMGGGVDDGRAGTGDC